MFGAGVLTEAVLASDADCQQRSQCDEEEQRWDSFFRARIRCVMIGIRTRYASKTVQTQKYLSAERLKEEQKALFEQGWILQHCQLNCPKGPCCPYPTSRVQSCLLVISTVELVHF